MNKMQYQIEVIRSDRKTISIEIRPDLRVIVRAPLRMRQNDIQRFTEEKIPWIEKHMEMMKQRMEEQDQGEGLEPFTEEEIRALGDRALEVIPKETGELAEMIGVSYGRITIRNQVSRWGSCSSKGNLNFNCLLMLCPPEVRRYVIIHELCHRKHMDHSKEFWAMAESYCPDYKKQKEWLKQNGGELIKRLRM